MVAKEDGIYIFGIQELVKILLGRKYIKEFTSESSSSAYYLCILCEVTLSWKEIADHMMGYKHRLKSIRRSHPKVYDKICLIQNKVDMLGQCAKYALELENKHENIVWVDTKQPEATAIQHLKKIQGDKTPEKDRREDKKDEDDRKKKEEKKEDKSDTTSDIFKKIEAYKKKFEACKDNSEEIPAKRARTEGTKTTGLTFEDLSKQNKTLAETIEKGIASARKGAEQKKNERDVSKKTTPAKKGAQKSSHKEVAKKSSTAVKGNNETKKVPQKVPVSKIEQEVKVADKEPEPKKEVGEKPKSVIIKVSESKINTSHTSKSKPKSVIIQVNDSKNNTDQTSKSDEQTKKVVNTESKVSAEDDVPVEKLEKTKSDVGKNEEKEKKGSTVPENDKAKVVTEENKKISEEVKKVSDKTNKINNEDKKTNDDSKKSSDEAKKVYEKTEDLEDDLVIATEDIEDLGKSISAELFSEELGDMEEEEETAMEEEETTEVKEGPFKGKMSNNPLSKLEKYFEVRRLKDPEDSGIVGLQYVVEGIPEKAWKAHMYRCVLCNVKCLTTSIVHHITGYKHRLKYLEVHHYDIYATIIKMDQSRKVLNAECSRHAKAIEEKEGLKTVMSLSEQEFRDREKEMNKEFEVPKRENTVTKEEEAAVSSSEIADKKEEPVEVEADKTEDKPETKVQYQFNLEKWESAKNERNKRYAARIKEAKAAAKLVKFVDGKETVELFKYIQQKPDVPLLGLSYITEIQGLCHNLKTTTYSCKLCFPSKKVEGTQHIYAHLVGVRHMEKYLSKHFSHKMIHLKLLTGTSAKISYLHNQAKLLCQGQLIEPEGIYVVNIAQMEQDKAALKMAEEAAKAVEEAAEAEKQALDEAKQAAMATTNKTAKKTTEAGKPSAADPGSEVIDLTAEEEKYETPTALLYSKLAGLQDIPLVGLSYITEIQGICADKVPPRYQCKLCDDTFISANYINAHITETEHRIRYLKANYPVFYSRAIGNRDETQKLCHEIEQQFGRESISVKKRILVRADGTVLYSEPKVVKAPVETPKVEQHKEKENASEKTEPKGAEMNNQLEEGERPEGGIVFNKIIEGLDCTPMLGLQYIKEVHHPTLNYPPVYDCDVCNIKNGPFLKPKTILKHICSKDHRLNFIRENHFHLYTEILQLSTEEQRKIAIDKHTKDIESKVGRGSITKIISDKPVYWSKSSVETSLPDSKVQETSQQDDGNQIADEDQPHYKCKKCGMILAKERRVSHIIAVHVSCYKCKICQLSFPDHFYLQKHMTLIHKSKQVAPNANLNHQFKMIKWFSWHAVRGKTFPVDTSGRLQLVCKECNRVVPLGQASEHYIYDHVKGYQCKKCNAPHGSNEALEKHLQKRHNITENVPVVNYTADVQLSKMFIHVYSSKAPEFIDLTESEESKPRIGIKKYICNRCQTLFIDGNTAELHYKHCHFFEYPCTMCNYIFRIAVHLEKHYSSLHRVYRSVKTPVISFESCYHVCLENNKRMLLDAYLKEANITWKELSKTFENAPETASTTPATNVVPKTTITTTTIPNQQSGQYVQNLTGQSSESGGPTTSSRVSPDGNKSGPVNFDEIMSRREDPLFDWDTEHKRLKKRMELGGIVNCARKSKFMMNYTSTFSNYPLIGLQMMTEFQQKDISAEPWYMCEMCQDRINWKAITPHIVSLKHRILYLEKNHPVLHDMLKQKQFDTMESLMSKVETLAQGVVKKEGKQFSISVMLELPPSEKELKMLAEEEKIAQGTDVQLKFGFNPTAQINTGTTNESPKSKTPKQANNSAQLASSSMSTQQGENKTMEEPKKKLPAWVRIPKSSDKDNVAHDERSVSAAVTKEASSDLKPKVDDNKDSNKKQVSDSKRRDEKSGRSKERRRSKSRSRDRRSSRHSTRTRHDDKYSRDRRRRSADRDTRRDNKDDHSRKRRRSRSRDRTDSKTSRTKSPKAGSKEESRTQKGNEKNSAANKASFDKNKSNDKESAIGKHGDSNKHVSKDKELIVDTKNDTLDETETVMNVESLSIDELELISKSIEQQMEEDDDFIDIEDIVDEINPREEKSDEIVAPEKEANTDESQVKYLVENTAKENEPNLGEGQIKENVEKNSTVNIENQTKHQVKNVVVITAKENEPNLGEGQINENVEQNSTVNIENLTKIEIDVPNQIVNKSVCEKGIVKESDAAPENCVVEIVMTSPVKKNNSESKINQVLKPHEKPIVNISIQSNENDNERSLSSNEPSAMKRSETVKNANGAPQSIKQVSVPENKVEKECDITIEIKSNNEKKHEKGSESSSSEHHEIMLDKENCVSQTTEVSIDIVDNWKAGDEIETKSASLEDTDDITMPTDFDDFIASQLGEDFVTVDDADENSPTEIEICIPSLTNEDSNIPENESKVDVTEVSVEISESNNIPKPNGKNKTGSIDRPTRDELSKHKVLDSKITNIDDTQSAVSDLKSENDAKLKMNVDLKYKEISEAIMIKTPKKQSLNVQNVDTTKREEKTDEIKGEQSSSVCVLEISMEPSVLETDVPKEAGVADPYDDNEDIEFMLDEEFETVDETKDNNTEEEATVINYNEPEVNKEKTDQSANLDKVLPPEKNTEKMQSITTTAQDTDQEDNIADTHKDIVKEKDNGANEIKENTEMTLPENVEIDREGDNPPLGITHFPMDEDDDEDIEEIFLGGDFITVDEHKEDEKAPAIDTAEEEDFDMDFNPDDFVTVDEVDAGGTSVAQTDKPSQQKDKISTESFASSKGIHSSKNEADKCPERSSRRSREKTNKDSERSSKDKSDSKKSAGSNSHSSSRRSSSRVRDRDRHSSTSTKEKRDRSNPARKPTPEKSTRSSSRSSHTSRTSTAVDKSKSRQRDNVTNSEKTGRSGSNKVSAPILSKQTIQEMAAASRSGSRSSKERLGNYTVGQDGSPKQIDTHSYLGIPIKHSTDSPLSKVNSSKVNEEKTKPEYNKDKPSLNTKSEQISISKEGGERFRPSGSKTSNSKRTDLKPNVESESVGEKSGKGSESKGGSRSSNNDGKRKKDDKVECEISIEIG
ncbi:uncharacterized protein LOC132713662 [Ruditapes philippinarum]|uniref:uncharacterized protein LOC132713662 n=1 Tax=Ruditapes philippinarum TaxID=129788 RepID=UPI00295C02C8|nr:uncharacterized protein LOC132713662 [Ruditapes philippinarum]